jgi:hypothetical protein
MLEGKKDQSRWAAEIGLVIHMRLKSHTYIALSGFLWALIISLPSRAGSRPSLRACTQASKATQLAVAPGAFP